MADYIDRKDLLEDLERFAPEGRAALLIVRKQKTVDAVPVVHGRWRKTYTCHGEVLWGYECSQCKADNPRGSYYCPNCGAKMDLEVE